ncbi:hypothetical protein LZ190_15840 [Rhodovulum sulfidophilum]|nr:hypothetical protein [Rhodovulum sulfidophilum]
MILSLGIDGQWTARSLAAVLDSLEAMSGYLETGTLQQLNRDRYHATGRALSIVFSVEDHLPPQLQIKRMSYASPGCIDFVGLGKALEQIRLFLEFLIEHCASRNDRELDREERKIQLAQKRLELLGLLQSQHPAIASFVEENAADALIEAVFDKRICSAEISSLEESP